MPARRHWTWFIKVHEHPVPSIIYNITDCVTKLYAADGKSTENKSKAGTANAVPIIASHAAENIGPDLSPENSSKNG